jgi:hypothetical protein
MLLRENQLFGCAQKKPNQGGVPAVLTLASDFGFCFQCKVGSILVLRRPIETTAVTGKVASYSKFPVTRRTVGQGAHPPRQAKSGKMGPLADVFQFATYRPPVVLLSRHVDYGVHHGHGRVQTDRSAI